MRWTIAGPQIDRDKQKNFRPKLWTWMVFHFGQLQSSALYRFWTICSCQGQDDDLMSPHGGNKIYLLLGVHWLGDSCECLALDSSFDWRKYNGTRPSIIDGFRPQIAVTSILIELGGELAPSENLPSWSLNGAQFPFNEGGRRSCKMEYLQRNWFFSIDRRVWFFHFPGSWIRQFHEADHPHNHHREFCDLAAEDYILVQRMQSTTYENSLEYSSRVECRMNEDMTEHRYFKLQLNGH